MALFKLKEKEELDKTAELVPIDSLRDILFNEEKFNDFFNVRNEFSDIDITSYSNALNEYMDFLVEASNDTPEFVFDRINKINEELGINKKYNYLLYKLEDKSEISLEIIEFILNDEEAYQKFMNFYDNQVYFNNIPIIDYLSALSEYNEAIQDSNNLTMNSLAYERLGNIKRKYALEYRKAIILTGEHVEAEIDPSFEESILSKVDFTKNKFAIAYSIYIELNKRCSYDTTFLAYAQDMSIDIVNEIYDKDVSKINEFDNKVVCNTWAIIYQNLLSKCGFKANVTGGFHKYVEFDCDGTWMKADGTQVYRTDDGLYYDDIVRCQLGLPTVGFVCLENDKDIREVITTTATDINYNMTDRDKITQDAINEYKSKFMSDEEVLSFDDKIDIIINAVRNCNYQGFEVMQYFKLLYETGLTKEEIAKTDFNYIAIKLSDRDFKSGIVLTYKNDEGEIIHYIYEEGTRFIQVSSQNLNDMLNSGSVILIGHRREIMGLEGNFGNGLAK